MSKAKLVEECEVVEIGSTGGDGKVWCRFKVLGSSGSTENHLITAAVPARAAEQMSIGARVRIESDCARSSRSSRRREPSRKLATPKVNVALAWLEAQT